MSRGTIDENGTITNIEYVRTDRVILWTMLKNVSELKTLYKTETCTTQKFPNIPHRPRWVNFLYAKYKRFFWLACPHCLTKFGGHEWYGSDENTNKAICPECTLKIYNQTGDFNIEKHNKIKP